MRNRSLALLWGCASLLVSACDSDLVDPSQAARYEGDYSLSSVDGRYVPYVVSTEGDCFTIYEGGTVALRRDGSFRLTLDHTRTFCEGKISSARALRVEGTYRVDGEHIHFAATNSSSPSEHVARFYPREGSCELKCRLSAIHLDSGGRQYAFVEDPYGVR